MNPGSDWPNWRCVGGIIAGNISGSLTGLGVGGVLVGGLVTAGVTLSTGGIAAIVIGITYAGAIGGTITGAIENC